MKKYLIIIIVHALAVINVQAQSLDHVVVSSGGLAGDTLNATLGEVFVFSISNNDISINAGSQSDLGNTGTASNNEIQNNNPGNNMLLYPNPVKDYVNLRVDGLKETNVSFQVFDINGKIVMSQNMFSTNKIFTLNVQMLIEGTYILSGITPEGQSIGNIKIVKQ